MDVKGITGIGAYQAYSASYSAMSEKKPSTETAPETTKTENQGVVYERSSTDAEIKAKENKKTYKANPDLVAKMKADAEARTSELKSLVEKIILKQAEKGSNIFDFLGSEYSAEDIMKAQEDVSENGYYGVKQTSQRILDFAVALTGGDPEKMEKMRDAFEKGFKQAEKTWGGELPEICQQTYDAVFKGFDKFKEDAAAIVE